MTDDEICCICQQEVLPLVCLVEVKLLEIGTVLNQSEVILKFKGIFLIVVLLCILISSKLFCQQMHPLIKT
jgi:hypothetical protein